MTDSVLSQQENRPIRVLFLRSTAQPTFAAFVAGGLDHSPNIIFEQYPPYRGNEWDKLDKLYDPEGGLEKLCCQLIADKNKLLEKLYSGFFDVVLLMDYDGSLFPNSQMGRMKQWRNILGHFKSILQVDFDTILHRIMLSRGLPISIEDINKLLPVAVIDLDDWICLSPTGQDYLLSCSCYFKRELPFNRFFLFYQQRPAPWRKWRRKLLDVTNRAHNIPLGIEDKKYHELKKQRFPNQDIDIFYCGEITSTLRQYAVTELQALADEQDLRIIISDSLPFAEYCRYVAKSKVTISISGGGWDCFRHYEAAALGSVPFMDMPGVDAYWWREIGTSQFFKSDFSDFAEKLLQLVNNSQLRETCRNKLENHIESYLLHSKIVDFMVRISRQKQSEKNLGII